MKRFILSITLLFISLIFVQETVNAQEPEITGQEIKKEPEIKESAEAGESKSLEEVNKMVYEKIAEVKEMIEEAKNANEKGDYDSGYEYAQKAKKLASEILLLRAKKFALFKIEEAKKLISQAEQMESQKYVPDELTNAKSSLLSAENYYNSEDYDSAVKSAEESINYAKSCIYKTREMKKKEAEAEIKKKEEITKKDKEGPYKIIKRYKVRYIPKRRDCLWRIAEYKSIYGNPRQWRMIYKVNKNKIRKSGLIYPGQIFDIPELDKKGNPILLDK